MDFKSPTLRLSSDSEESLSNFVTRDSQRTTTRARRHNILVASLVLVVLSFVGIFAFLFWTPYSLRLSTPISSPHDNSTSAIPASDVEEEQNTAVPSVLDPWDPRLSLNGPPTSQFRGMLCSAYILLLAIHDANIFPRKPEIGCQVHHLLAWCWLEYVI